MSDEARTTEQVIAAAEQIEAGRRSIAALRDDTRAYGHMPFKVRDKHVALLHRLLDRLAQQERDLGALRESNAANIRELHRADARIGQAEADVSRLTGQLAEAQAAFSEVAGWFPSTSLMREVFTDEQLGLMALTLDSWSPASAGPRWARLIALRAQVNGGTQ